MKTFEHYTLNTGHTYMSPRSGFNSVYAPFFLPLIENGIHRMPGTFSDDYYLMTTIEERGGVLASVVSDSYDEQLLITMAVASDDNEAEVMWPVIQRYYQRYSSAVRFLQLPLKPYRRPKAAPWCAVVTSLFIAFDREAVMWLGDFERCLAWTWIERKTI